MTLTYTSFFDWCCNAWLPIESSNVYRCSTNEFGSPIHSKSNTSTSTCGIDVSCWHRGSLIPFECITPSDILRLPTPENSRSIDSLFCNRHGMESSHSPHHLINLHHTRPMTIYTLIRTRLSLTLVRPPLSQRPFQQTSVQFRTRKYTLPPSLNKAIGQYKP